MCEHTEGIVIVYTSLQRARVQYHCDSCKKMLEFLLPQLQLKSRLFMQLQPISISTEGRYL